MKSTKSPVSNSSGACVGGGGRPLGLSPAASLGSMPCARCGALFARRNSAQRLCSKVCQVAVSSDRWNARLPDSYSSSGVLSRAAHVGAAVCPRNARRGSSSFAGGAP